jgi:hypothetical protein
MRNFLLGAAALCAFATPALAANQLTNGSFEDGTNGWTLGGVSDDGYPPVVITYNNTNSYPTGAFGESIPVDDVVSSNTDAAGTHALYFVADQAHPQTLSQLVSVVAGKTYTFGFDVYVPFNGAQNINDASFSAVVGGLNFATFTASSLTAGQWLHYGATGVANITGTTTFDFAYNSFGIPAKDFVIDKVFFGTTSVPEPASWALMLFGFGAMGTALRARRKATVTYA